MVRRSALVFVLALAALALAAPAGAQKRALWPGVTYDTELEMTSHGPVVLNVLIGPRPGGTTTLEPILSNGTLLGRETLTSMQRRLRSTATTAGINADFFSFDNGLPSGVVIQQTQLVHPPDSARSSLGLSTDGTLDVRRVAFFATWQATGQKRILNQLNGPVPLNGTGLFTQAYGATTPAYTDSSAVVLFPFPTAVPGVDLQASVVEARGSGAASIPIGGAVLVARGQAAQTLATEAPLGATVVTNFILKPDWPDIVSAIGGGPQIVRDGAPVFRAGEAFTAQQLSPRAPRSAVGQLADGRIVLVAVDGRQPGYSVGLTNFELAQALVRLGAVTGMAFDGGGSTTMAADGTLLNHPSDGSERPISTALMFMYTGVYVEPLASVVSPDGDGYNDGAELRYRLVRPANVTVTLTAPDRTAAFTETADLQPGIQQVAFPPPVAPGAPQAPLDGRWTLAVQALDDLGQQSAMSQSFTVNTTVGFLRPVPARLFTPPGGRNVAVTWRQALAARVVVTIEDANHQIVRTLALRRYQPGPQQVTWNGLDRAQRRVKGGIYLAHLVAQNALGKTELEAKIPVRQIAGPPRPRQ